MKISKKIIWLSSAYIALLIISKIFIPAAHAACTNQDVLCNPISQTTVPQVVVTVIQVLLEIIGLLSGLFIIIGGFQYVLSGGNSESAQKGRQTVTYAIIGLVLAILAFAMVRIVVNTLTATPSTTNTSPTPPPPGPNPPPPAPTCTTTNVPTISVSGVTFKVGDTFTFTPSLPGGIPAGCTGGVQIVATLRSNTDATKSVRVVVPGDNQQASIQLSGSAFTIAAGSSDTYALTVTYLDSSTTPASQFAQGTGSITVSN